ncbi:MAG: NUDIX domain-containing protein [Rhodobiaceae bacterium]|nr:NUDIX domain-containing protein [Rhodobiaceae bacterium]MCC0017250.1 NUDIX domain-containing protein [Rhodobiaceae bacterium]MCC0041825.1 NUDIX domain-containing protein [Rhodobiaceae bacterium]MCC0054386.1 NUDIX domain-containing protein [Rhodobiaceae bacterium]
MIGAASVSVFRGGEVLLVKRAKPPFLWSLPGGRIEVGESAREAALRELAEETGVAAEIVAQGHVLEIDTGAERYCVTNFAALYLGGEAVAMTDAADVAWADREALTRFSLTGKAPEVIAHARDLVERHLVARDITLPTSS